MSRNRHLVWLRCVPPHRCEFLCGRRMLSKSVRSETEGWEWFSGYGDGPLHFCPECRRKHQFLINQVRDALNEKPYNYPENRHVAEDVLRTVLDAAGAANE